MSEAKEKDTEKTTRSVRSVKHWGKKIVEFAAIGTALMFLGNVAPTFLNIEGIAGLFNLATAKQITVLQTQLDYTRKENVALRESINNISVGLIVISGKYSPAELNLIGWLYERGQLRTDSLARDLIVNRSK